MQVCTTVGRGPLVSASEQPPRSAMDKIAYYAITLFEAVLGVFGIRGLYEQPRYTVVEHLDRGVEIRAYDERLAVETDARGQEDGEAFGRCLVDLCEHVERRYGVRYSLWGLSCLLDRLNLSRQKTRPSHPTGDPAAQAAFEKEAAGNAPGSRG